MTASPRWQHVITDAGHHLRLTGANGEPILTSEVYVDGAGVADALVLARRATSTWSGQQPDLVDQRDPTRAHEVEVTRIDTGATAHLPEPVRWIHHCTVCGYRGSAAPPLPCPGPPPADTAPAWVAEDLSRLLLTPRQAGLAGRPCSAGCGQIARGASSLCQSCHSYACDGGDDIG